ncbi:unnamed protein product [Owenia fusiformis]|uniref:Uncharacterized protein n=1 Tax=Owenia fusiformis TaxID=6347 RepID=A0A8J1UFS5_OWEFU|nr:unnamed protein product [Owenia fusiformis]
MNETGEPDPNPMFEGLGDRVLQVVGLSILTVGCLFGNMFMCVVIKCNKTLHSIPNMLVFSLGITDLGVGLLNSPLNLVLAIAGRNIFGANLCNWYGVIIMVLTQCTMLHMCLMAINRYIMVCHPMKYRSVFTRKSVAIFIGIIWSISFLMAFLPVMGWGSYKMYQTFGCCLPNFLEGLDFMITDLVLITLVPTNVMIFCYFMVFKTVRNSKRKIAAALKNNKHAASSNLRKNDKKKRKEMNITKVVLMIMVSYFVCYTPFLILFPINDIFGIYIPYWAGKLSAIFVVGSSACNPIILYLLSSEFRKAYIAMLPMMCQGRLSASTEHGDDDSVTEKTQVKRI